MATWKDIEIAARQCPVLKAAVQSVKSGKETREEALASAALRLSSERVERAAHDREFRSLADEALETIRRIRQRPTIE